MDLSRTTKRLTEDHLSFIMAPKRTISCSIKDNQQVQTAKMNKEDYVFHLTSDIPSKPVACCNVIVCAKDNTLEAFHEKGEQW
jgi:hypothetical protein